MSRKDARDGKQLEVSASAATDKSDRGRLTSAAAAAAAAAVGAMAGFAEAATVVRADSHTQQ